MNELKYRFVPKMDITTYELARILMEIKIGCTEKLYDTFDYSISRHFRKKEENEEQPSNPSSNP